MKGVLKRRHIHLHSKIHDHRVANPLQFIYRLTKCGELSLGLFSTAIKDPALTNTATAAHAAFPDSNDLKAKEVLLAHVIATKCLTKVITDDAMGFPSDWQSEKPNPTNLGHHEAGRTVGVHSLAVLPMYQRIGLGTVILQSYLQRIGSSEIADRVALIAHDYLVPYYETFGFQSLGKSEAQFGGGGWYDMVSLTFVNAIRNLTSIRRCFKSRKRQPIKVGLKNGKDRYGAT